MILHENRTRHLLWQTNEFQFFTHKWCAQSGNIARNAWSDSQHRAFHEKLLALTYVMESLFFTPVNTLIGRLVGAIVGKGVGAVVKAGEK